MVDLKNEYDELRTIKLTFANGLDSQCLYHIQLFCEKLFKKLNKEYSWSVFYGIDDKTFGHSIIKPEKNDNKKIIK